MNSLPILDKMAVVFHGIIGGMDGRNGVGSFINVTDCAKLIKHNILSMYDCDIFMHSWSVEQQDLLVPLYNPKKYLFQPQEMFGYSFNDQTFKDEDQTHSFRTVSRYASLERAMELKKQYEIDNNFKYKWVLVLRFDLAFFNKLILDNLDPSCFYICSEPHWPNIQDLQVVHDILFLSNSNTLDTYCEIAGEIRNKVYDDTLHAAHVIAYRKLMLIYNNDIAKVRYVFKRYEDVEIYRFVVKPKLNTVGHAYGVLETKDRMESLLKSL